VVALVWAVLGCTRPNPSYNAASGDGGAADASPSLGEAGGASPALYPALYYDFESGTEGWKDIRYTFFGVPETPVTTSSAMAHHGTRALAMTLTTPDEKAHPTFGVQGPALTDRLTAGMRIVQWIWFPADAPLVGAQGFVYCYRLGRGPWWVGELTPIHELVPGEWNRFENQVPADLDLAAGGVIDFGIEWIGDRALTGLTVYIDDVSIWAP
jgi:hypothetical protein